MAKKKKAVGREYVLSNGEVYVVTGETGKYYLCEGGTQFRKSAKRGVLRDAAEPTAEEE